MTFRMAGEVPNTPYGETSTRSGGGAVARSARSCAFAITALRSHGTIGHGNTSKTPARNASTVLSGRVGSTMPINTARGCSARTLRAMRRASPVRVQSSRQIAAGRSRNSARTSVAPDAQRTASPSPASTGSAVGPSSGPAAIQMIAGREPAECDRPALTCGSDIERLCLMACVTAGLRPCCRSLGCSRAEVPVPIRIAFDPWRTAIGGVDEPPVRNSPAAGVECDRRERTVLVALPLVGARVTVRVFFGPGEHTLVVGLLTERCPGGCRHQLHAREHALPPNRSGAPRALVRAACGVELLAVHPAVEVVVQLRPKQTRAVHEGPRILPSVAVSVVGQLLEPAGIRPVRRAHPPCDQLRGRTLRAARHSHSGPGDCQHAWKG